LPEKLRLGGSGPFVINLSVSTSPMSLPEARMAGGLHAHVYQIQRNEDRRMRYRLRLGPFANEDEADTVLELVRQIYPAALTATADADDLRAIAAIAAKTNKAKRTSPDVNAPPPAERALESARVIEPVRTVESTHTVRALTPLELEAGETSRWFVIQLSLSEQAFDPNTVPELDIFSLYRLYSVVGLDQGRVRHALRLGFFGEETAAAAVASYLGAYYEKPIIKRVSVAERERFGDQRVEARKDVGATGKNAVIEITNERHVRDSNRRVPGAR
jgi:hypothetical protein